MNRKTLSILIILAVGAVLEESGFGSDVAAPLVAKVLEALYADTVPAALTAIERAEAFANRDDAVATTTTADGSPS